MIWNVILKFRTRTWISESCLRIWQFAIRVCSLLGGSMSDVQVRAEVLELIKFFSSKLMLNLNKWAPRPAYWNLLEALLVELSRTLSVRCLVKLSVRLFILIKFGQHRLAQLCIHTPGQETERERKRKSPAVLWTPQCGDRSGT